jgi:hypothetical protein
MAKGKAAAFPFVAVRLGHGPSGSWCDRAGGNICDTSIPIRLELCFDGNSVQTASPDLSEELPLAFRGCQRSEYVAIETPT